MFAKPTTSILKRFTAAVVASTVLLSGPAFAADMLEDGSYNATTQVEYGTGWYLRGEVGTSVFGRDEESTSISDVSDQFSNVIDFNDALVGSAAVGKRFTSKLRGDISFSFLSSQDSNSIEQIDRTNCPGQSFGPTQVGSRTIVDTFGNAVGTEPIFEDLWRAFDIPNCSKQTMVEHHATVLSANGFYDVGQFGNFRPFVGAGLGVARVNYNNRASVNCIPGNDTQRCLNNGNPFPPTANDDGTPSTPQAGAPYSRPVEDNSGISYHIAGSVSAGAGYQLSQNLFLDTTYTYTHIFDEPLYDGTNGLAGADLDASSHQFKVGLRYEIW